MEKELLRKAKEALKAMKEKRLQASTQTKPVVKRGGFSEVAMKTLRKWGAGSFEKLITLNTADPKFRYIPIEEREQLKSFKEAVDVAVLMSQIFSKKIEDTDFFKTELQYHMKAFGIGSSDEGYEWIPTLISES